MKKNAAFIYNLYSKHFCVLFYNLLSYILYSFLTVYPYFVISRKLFNIPIMISFTLARPPPGYGILTNIRLAERPMLEAREGILRYGHQRLAAGTPDTDINITLLCHGRAGDLVPVKMLYYRDMNYC